MTSPPIMRASLRVMARPSPVPPNRWAVVASAWVNSSNSFACCSDVMPIPVSEIDNSTQLRAVAYPAPAQRHLGLLGELAGIAQQVEQDLPQPHGIDGKDAEVLSTADIPSRTSVAAKCCPAAKIPLLDHLIGEL